MKTVSFNWPNKLLGTIYDVVKNKQHIVRIIYLYSREKLLAAPLQKRHKIFKILMHMKLFNTLISLFISAILVFSCTEERSNSLRVSDVNPRYFTDNTGRAVYLTGSHTWNNLVDMVVASGIDTFNYNEYLDFLKLYNHNFIRMWAWDLLTWNTRANREAEPVLLNVTPQPWLRSGPENALDGKPKFDLTKFNPEYFGRLKDRVKAASDRNIFVSVMLFEGWGLQFSPGSYENHPFNPENNINETLPDSLPDSLRLVIYELNMIM